MAAALRKTSDLAQKSTTPVVKKPEPSIRAGHVAGYQHQQPNRDLTCVLAMEVRGQLWQSTGLAARR